MANPKQVEMLVRSVKEWNQWRDSEPFIRPDLQRADLAGANLSGDYLALPSHQM